MSTDTCVVYFGLRFEIEVDEIESIELRSDPRVVSARKSGLKYYWGNFGGLDEKNLLFVGYQIGILGPENLDHVILSATEAEAAFEATRQKLKEGGFADVPAIHITWQPDV